MKLACGNGYCTPHMATQKLLQTDHFALGIRSYQSGLQTGLGSGRGRGRGRDAFIVILTMHANPDRDRD